MLRAVDELIGDGAIVRRDVGRPWPAELDEQQLMDLVFTVGAYEMLALAFRSFGVELDEDLQRK